MSEAILAYTRKEHIVRMAQIETVAGREVLGVLIEADLQAIAIYLTGIHGPEKAFEIFSRHADGIIKPVMDERARRPRR
jgi:hypothetical protein